MLSLFGTSSAVLNGYRTPTITDEGFYTGGPPVSRTQHQRIQVCVAFTTPWTISSPSTPLSKLAKVLGVRGGY